MKFEVYIHKDKHIEAVTWCEQQFGERWVAIDHKTGRWCCFWAGREKFSYYRFYFQDEQDCALFMLRWL